MKYARHMALKMDNVERRYALRFPCLLGSIGSHRAPELGPELGPSSIFNNSMQLHQILEQVNWRKECPPALIDFVTLLRRAEASSLAPSPAELLAGRGRALRMKYDKPSCRFGPVVPHAWRVDLANPGDGIVVVVPAVSVVRTLAAAAQSAPALRRLCRLALVCGIMIPKRCVPDADDVSG